MNTFCLTLREDHYSELRRLTEPASGHEGAAILLCRTVEVEFDPWDCAPRTKLISAEVLPIEATAILSSLQRPTSRILTVPVRWKVQQSRAQELEGLVIAIVHSHRRHFEAFSGQDNHDEPGLVELAQHRNGPQTLLVSLICLPAGRVIGRVWKSRTQCMPLNVVRVIGSRFHVFFSDTDETDAPDAFSRQVLAFGPMFTKAMQRLRLGVVGSGATGSAISTLLLRHGVGRLAIFDADRVDATTLTRMHGSTLQDAQRSAFKVDVIERCSTEIGLGTQVARFPNWASDESCRDALKACDFIFGCTDDHSGRLLLNRFAYFYLTPLLDMGVIIDPAPDRRRILEAAGRTTVVQPGSRCLLCREVIDPVVARDEQLRRKSPDEFEKRYREGYVRGVDLPNPAVMFLTTDVACMAFDEFVHRLTGYRTAGSADHRVRKFLQMQDKFPGAVGTGECEICQGTNYWGRGDVNPFLDRCA